MTKKVQFLITITKKRSNLNLEKEKIQKQIDATMELFASRPAKCFHRKKKELLRNKITFNFSSGKITVAKKLT
uniref:Uncharacterized protein n=1 Tax=Panagrolaimus sp. JU765 TaxID=591449 RepID=A0AC34Q1J3_9BILA